MKKTGVSIEVESNDDNFLTKFSDRHPVLYTLLVISGALATALGSIEGIRAIDLVIGSSKEVILGSRQRVKDNCTFVCAMPAGCAYKCFPETDEKPTSQEVK